MIFLSTFGGKKHVSGMLLPLKLKVRQIIQVTSLKTACIPTPLPFATLVGEYDTLPVYFFVVAKASPKPSAFFSVSIFFVLTERQLPLPL